MKRWRVHWPILLITLVAGVLRFYRLTAIPPGLYWDEVAIGYSAYSITQTGMDEYGQSYPMSFRSLGDYKYPGYIYATALSMKLFGKSEFAVRFPSALAGTLTVLAIYFLVKELFPERLLNIKHNTLNIGEIAAFLLAISPWHLQFSRAAFEANLALFFIIVGWWFFLLALRNQGIYLAISVVFFVLSAATYISTRLFAPLILFTFVWLCKETIRKQTKELGMAFVIGAILSLPLIPPILSGEALIRARSESIIGKEKLFPKVFENYLANFDTTYLFFRGDQNGRHSVRKLGMLHLFELPLILIGLRSLLLTKGRGRSMTLAWLILSPVTVSLSNINPHAIRTLHVLPAWEIVAAVGAWTVIQQIRRMREGLRRIVAFTAVSLVVGYNIVLYLHQYYVHYPRETARDWQDGLKETVEIIASQHDQYEEIFLTDELPPIYLAFYLPVEPAEYQRIISKEKIGKIYYFTFAWDIQKESPKKKALVISPYWQKPTEGTSFQEVKILNGDIVYNIWEE